MHFEITKIRPIKPSVTKTRVRVTSCESELSNSGRQSGRNSGRQSGRHSCRSTKTRYIIATSFTVCFTLLKFLIFLKYFEKLFKVLLKYFFTFLKCLIGVLKCFFPLNFTCVNISCSSPYQRCVLYL